MQPKDQDDLLARLGQINQECVAAGPDKQADITNDQLRVLRTRMACSEVLEQQLHVMVDRPLWHIIWCRLRGGR